LVSEQAYPQENVGVFVQRGRGGPLSVVEYSEMDAAMTTEINQSTGRLRYCWSNVCLYPCLPLPPLDHGDSYQYQLHIVFFFAGLLAYVHFGLSKSSGEQP
jgi:hypothetical protein